MPTAKGRLLREGSFRFLLAGFIGAAAGLLGYGFQTALSTFLLLGLAEGDTVVEAAEQLSPWLKVTIPALGGLLAALTLLSIGGRRGPFGITDAMELVITRQGFIRLRHSLVQIISSGFSICTGSSIGREGANSQLGATVASALGRLFGLAPRDRAVLLGCGIAGGMAVSYNAPIAGALFVMEVVLGNFAMDVFAPIVVSAVTATLTYQSLHPSGALYDEVVIATIEMTDARLVLSALVLGVVCGAAGIGFRRSLDLGRALFARARMPIWLSLPVGGAIVGGIGIWAPEVWGNGYDVVHGIITGDLVGPGISFMLAIMLLKVLATSISIGSGCLGGVFTPNLVVGAALGAAYGFGVAAIVPVAEVGLERHQITAGFALVGMAGLCAATTHAPITAVLLVFEFTRNYDLILPVMLCSIIGSIVARMIDADSIYSARLKTKGYTLAAGIEALAMQTNYVRDVMRTDVASLRDTATFAEVVEAFAAARRDTIFVVDERQRLVGRIHIHDVKSYLNQPDLTAAVIAADLMTNAESVTPDQSLAAIFHLFDDPDLDVLPVVEPGTDRLIGRLTRRDVIALLTSEVLGQRNLRAKLRSEDAEEDTYVQLPAQSDLARVRVPPSMVGQTLREADLLGTWGLTVLVVIETDETGRERRVLPRADLRLGERSALVVLGSKEAIEAFEAIAA